MRVGFVSVLDYRLWSRCWSRARQVRALLKDEADDVRQCGIVAQLPVLIARNVVDLADGREHFGLFDGVDAEVSFEIEIQIQHVFRIAGLLYHQRENAFLDGIANDDLARMSQRAPVSQHHSGCRRCEFDFFLRLADGLAAARSGRFSYTKRMTCASVG